MDYQIGDYVKLSGLEDHLFEITHFYYGHIEVRMLQMIRLDVLVKYFSSKMQCKCDHNKWMPERSTKHSFACPIHQNAMNVHSTLRMCIKSEDIESRLFQ